MRVFAPSCRIRHVGRRRTSPRFALPCDPGATWPRRVWSRLRGPQWSAISNELRQLADVEQELAELGEAFRAELLRPGGFDLGDGFADTRTAELPRAVSATRFERRSSGSGRRSKGSCGRLHDVLSPESAQPTEVASRPSIYVHARGRLRHATDEVRTPPSLELDRWRVRFAAARRRRSQGRR
jgi:hypothetical protein